MESLTDTRGLESSTMSLLKWSCVIVAIAATYTALKSRFEHRLPIVVDGYYHPTFKPLADAFTKQVENGKERGGALAVYQHGRLVFDMWGGYADEESQRPWQQDTMTQVFSVSKGIVAIVIASLVEKGLVDYKRPVVDYWPEFGQNEKGNITVEMLLSHQSGLVLLDEEVHLREILDNPEKIQKILAAQKTVWPAGSKMGYHMVTYGMYADTLVQKIDPKGRTSTQVFLEDIAKPFGIDAFMNCPKELYHRAAKLYSGTHWEQLMHSFLSDKYFSAFAHMILNPNCLLAKAAVTIKELSTNTDRSNNPDLREVTMSSASVTGTARGLAKLYGILANGGKNGDSTLLSKRTIDLLKQPLVSGIDEVTTLQDITYGRGMWHKKNPKGQMIYGHPGYGGNVAFADPENSVGYSYITNFLSIYGVGDDPRFITLQDVMYQCIDKHDSLK